MQNVTSSSCCLSFLACSLLSSFSMTAALSSSLSSFITSSSSSILACVDSKWPFHCLACSSSFRVASSSRPAALACSFSLICDNEKNNNKRTKKTKQKKNKQKRTVNCEPFDIINIIKNLDHCILQFQEFDWFSGHGI